MRKDEQAVKDAMSDREQLVQRFVDQELPADERVRFIARLGRDASLRERVLQMEQLVLEVSGLPRPVVTDAFVGNVLARTAAIPVRSDVNRKPRFDFLWRPRVLRWNLASAVAAACVLLIALGGAIAGALRWGRPTGTPPSDTVISSVSTSRPTVLVRLVVVQPDARTVQAAGDFNGWNPARTPLEQASNGAWTVTIPLEPGRYEYMFVVDGQEWVGDPYAVEQNEDGFGSRNAVLDVRPPVEAPL